MRRRRPTCAVVRRDRRGNWLRACPAEAEFESELYPDLFVCRSHLANGAASLVLDAGDSVVGFGPDAVFVRIAP